MASKVEEDWQAFLRYRLPAVDVTQTPNAIEFKQWVTSVSAMSLVFTALPVVFVVGLLVVGLLIAAHKTVGWFALPLDIAGFALLAYLLGKAVYRIQRLRIEPGRVIFRRGDGTSPQMRAGTFIIQALGLAVASWAIISLILHLNRVFSDYRGNLDWDRMMGHSETIFVGIMMLGIAALYFLLLWLVARFTRGRGIGESINYCVIPVQEIRTIDVRTGDSFEAKNISIRLQTIVIWHGPHPVGTISAGDYESAISLKEGVVAAIGVMNQTTGPVAAKRRTFDE